MPVRGQLHHVELYVADLEQSLDWWGWLLEKLGYAEYQIWDGGKSYRLGETYLVFVQTEAEHLLAPYHRKQVGLNHLAFHGGTRTEVLALTDELRERGVKVLYPDRHPFAAGDDHLAVFVEDPNRIKVEIVADER